MWDYIAGTKLCYWRAERGVWSRAAPRITALDFINPHDVSLLLVGSEDGTVRVWSHYANFGSVTKDPQLVSAWQAIPDATHSTTKIGYTTSMYLFRSKNIRNFRHQMPYNCKTRNNKLINAPCVIV